MEVCLEAFRLAAKVISIHAYVQPAYKFLATLLCAVRRFSEEDEAGACPPDWPSQDFYEIAKRFQEAGACGDEGHGCAFAARDDETIALRELPRRPDLDELPLQVSR